MDDYPEHLAPEFNEAGGVVTPFDTWWSKVRDNFPNVPDDVAQYWLHEHWRHSPYGYLRSRDYRFELEEWDAQRLWDIRSRWCDFVSTNTDCVEHGEYLLTLACHPYCYSTALYMIANGEFPTPIIVLDNRDGHLGVSNVTEPWEVLPSELILIEGHRRFNLALHLQRIGKLRPIIKIWIMKRA
jgi:hypothetical protein